MAFKGLFITGTGTEVGKTFVTCAVARYLRKRGVLQGVMKPVASGGQWRKIEGRRMLIGPDAIKLKAASGSRENLSRINPVCYKNPLAPYTASYIENKKFSFSKVMRSYRKIRSRCSFMLAEGIGGVCVPLTRNTDVTDLMSRMKLPVIVVASAKLGTLNHTFLTWDYLKKKQIHVLGLVLNDFNGRGTVDRTNLRYFKEKNVPVLAVVPKSSKNKLHLGSPDQAIEKSPLGRWLRINAL